MASLEDFFAKKDKKKRGKNKNFLTSELLAKNIEEQATVAVQPQPEQETKAKIDLPAAPTQEDEWKEEEEHVKDLEGLRVQKLDKDDEKQSENVQVKPEDNVNAVMEGDSSAPRDSSAASPWQSVTAPETEADTASQDDTEPVPEVLPEKLPNVQSDVYVPPASREGGAYVPPGARESGGAYVPPHVKRGMGGGGGTYVPPYMRRGMGSGGRGNKLPPDLNSAVAFPSLHDVSKKGDGSSSEKGTDFKEVQGPKTSRTSDTSYCAPGLELTNKFSGLEDNN